jgi:chromosome segregation ATPase
MAAFKFYNVTKANEEIHRLESSVEELTNQIETLKGNDTAIAAEAEKVRGEYDATKLKLTQAESDLATAKASIVSLTAEKDKAVADLTAANAAIPVQIKNAASAQAAAITAGIGVPPVAAEVKTQEEAQTWAQKAVAAAAEKANHRK